MSQKILKTIVKLRRGDESYYESLAEYVPLNGEVSFIDTNSGALRMKVGDGSTKLEDIEYADQYLIDQINSIVVNGYFIDNEFYQDTEKKVKFVPYSYKMYIDLPTKIIYTYDDSEHKYYTSGNTVEHASSTVDGIMKLYDETGNNTDGTITQKTISDEIGKRFLVSAGEDETLDFLNN